MPELDGTNSLKFYYVDLFESVCRVIQDPRYADQLYHVFEMQTDGNGSRMFQRANSGLVFEGFQLLDPTVSPILVIIASDPSHQGHISRHPLYCKFSSWLYAELNTKYK
jgi:hypothetical protein